MSPARIGPAAAALVAGVCIARLVAAARRDRANEGTLAVFRELREERLQRLGEMSRSLKNEHLENTAVLVELLNARAEAQVTQTTGDP